MCWVCVGLPVFVLGLDLRGCGMIEAMEVLLRAWGDECVSPSLEVSIASPLGRVNEDVANGQGGSRCLSTVECWVAMSRAAQAVDQALAAIELDAARGWSGRVVVQLAQQRYCQAPRLPVVEQCRRLGISERTYRTRVDELHAALAEALPGVAAVLARAELSTGVHGAKVARARAAKDAVRDAVRRSKRQAAARAAFARSVRRDVVGA